MRASSSAFAWGQLVYTDYNSGCLRKILVQSREVYTEIDPKYGRVGTANEDLHAKSISGRFAKEAEFRRELSYPVTISGHADFVHHDETWRATSVDELKSVSSPNTRRIVIKNGNYKTENLAQLVCYMWAFDVTRGRLIYRFFDKDEQPTDDVRIFEVDVDEFGRINVDSKPSQFTIHDLFSHQQQAARTIATGHVPQRPYRWDAPFVSPCSRCAFAKACDEWDQGTIVSDEAYVERCKELAR